MSQPRPASRTRLRARISTATAAATAPALLIALTACSGGPSHPAATAKSPTPAAPAPLPTQAPSQPVKDGHFTFTLLSLHCGVMGVTGTHSEATPDGQFCTAILRVRNDDQEYHTYVTKQQRLEGVSAPRNAPDGFAMAVRRQNPEEKVGGSDLMEVELWYDVPLGAKVTGLRVAGDQDPAGWLDNRPVAHAADGVFIPMAPLMDS